MGAGALEGMSLIFVNSLLHLEVTLEQRTKLNKQACGHLRLSLVSLQLRASLRNPCTPACLARTEGFSPNFVFLVPQKPSATLIPNPRPETPYGGSACNPSPNSGPETSCGGSAFCVLAFCSLWNRSMDSCTSQPRTRGYEALRLEGLGLESLGVPRP